MNKNNLNLEAILITHHHFDHTGGIPELSSKWKAKVYGPKGGHIKGIDLELSENSNITILDTQFHIFETPGQFETAGLPWDTSENIFENPLPSINAFDAFDGFDGFDGF